MTLCLCGCGQEVPIRKYKTIGYIKGHGSRGKSPSEEHRQKLSEANKDKLWTKEEEERLKELTSNINIEWKEISKELNRTKISCQMKAKRLGLKISRQFILTPEYIKKRSQDYQKKNREIIKKQRKEYYELNKRDLNEKQRKYYELNKAKIFKYNEEWRKRNLNKVACYKRKSYYKNPEIRINANIRTRKLRASNPEKYRLKAKIHLKKNPNFRIAGNINSSIRLHLLRYYQKKNVRTKTAIGCDIDFLKQHLESQFKKGMTWENYGKWHIDHIIPCAYFDLKNPEQLKICYNYRNLQPLWAFDNIKKLNKLPSNYLEKLEEIRIVIGGV